MKNESIPHFLGRHWKMTAAVAVAVVVSIVWGDATTEAPQPAPTYSHTPAQRRNRCRP